MINHLFAVQPQPYQSTVKAKRSELSNKAQESQHSIHFGGAPDNYVRLVQKLFNDPANEALYSIGARYRDNIFVQTLFGNQTQQACRQLVEGGASQVFVVGNADSIRRKATAMRTRFSPAVGFEFDSLKSGKTEIVRIQLLNGPPKAVETIRSAYPNARVEECDEDHSRFGWFSWMTPVALLITPDLDIAYVLTKTKYAQRVAKLVNNRTISSPISGRFTLAANAEPVSEAYSVLRVSKTSSQ